MTGINRRLIRAEHDAGIVSADERLAAWRALGELGADGGEPWPSTPPKGWRPLTHEQRLAQLERHNARAAERLAAGA